MISSNKLSYSSGVFFFVVVVKKLRQEILHNMSSDQ